MKTAVQEAIAEMRAAFPAAAVTVEEDGDGGAHVTVNPIDPGPAYTQDATWLKFQIAHSYPDADVYPLFVRPDLARADGGSHGEGFGGAEFRGEPALQLSRRSNQRAADLDTAVRKVHKVIAWLHAQ